MRSKFEQSFEKISSKKKWKEKFPQIEGKESHFLVAEKIDVTRQFCDDVSGWLLPLNETSQGGASNSKVCAFIFWGNPSANLGDRLYF